MGRKVLYFAPARCLCSCTVRTSIISRLRLSALTIPAGEISRFLASATHWQAESLPGVPGIPGSFSQQGLHHTDEPFRGIEHACL